MEDNANFKDILHNHETIPKKSMSDKPERDDRIKLQIINFSTHFGTVSPLSIIPLFNHYFYKKTKPLYPHPKYLFGIDL